MNPGFFHQQSNSSYQFESTSRQFPRLSAPNFSGFSASPEKPFLPMFGVPVASVSTNGDSGMSSRKRRSQNITNDMDMDARQRKVFISEERMVRGMSRLNLDQGPDILQDLATPEDELLIEEDGDKNLDGDGILKSEMLDEIDLEENDEMSAKVVLSDTLKQFVDRKQPILPSRVMERISQQQPPNMSRELVLWEPPGQQIRNAIRKALSSRRNEDDDDVIVMGMASQSDQSRTGGALPDLLILPNDDAPLRPEQLTNYVIPTDPSLTFEQMET